MAVVRPVLDRVETFVGLIEADDEARHAPAIQALRAAERTGRPLGNADFVRDLEARLRRPLSRRGPGRKPTPRDDGQAVLL